MNRTSTDPNPEKKLAGVLAPLFAVRGGNDSGIGTTRTLLELIDWAAAHSLEFVQMLPVNETGSDHSPYNLLSSMAIEPTTLSTNPADLPGLSRADYDEILREIPAAASSHVDYSTVARRNAALFQRAADRFFSEKKNASLREEFAAYEEDEAEWIKDYALYMALRLRRGGVEVLSNWPPEWRTPSSAREWLTGLPAGELREFERDRRCFTFVQWVADRQWRKVRAHAAKRGVLLVGDVPVGVSIYSVDVWTQPHLFDLSRSCGAPPEKVFQSDPFTMQWGQNWGFPLYNWHEMSRDNFWWWRRRLRLLGRYFDLLRVDHALGFYRIYSFPWRPERNAEFVGLTPEEAKAKTGGLLPGFVPNEDDTPEHCEANRIHGEVLLGILVEETGPDGLIAEDLGEVPDYVRPSLTSLGVSGFKIPQWERTPEGAFIEGKEYPRRAITTYATHDHPPLCEIWNDLQREADGNNPIRCEKARSEMLAFLEFGGISPSEAPSFLGPYNERILEILMRGLFSSNARLAAASINDLLGTKDRFNVPGTSDGQNWTARLQYAIADWDKHHSGAIAAWRTCLPRED